MQLVTPREIKGRLDEALDIIRVNAVEAFEGGVGAYLILENDYRREVIEQICRANKLVLFALSHEDLLNEFGFPIDKNLADTLLKNAITYADIGADGSCTEVIKLTAYRLQTTQQETVTEENLRDLHKRKNVSVAFVEFLDQLRATGVLVPQSSGEWKFCSPDLLNHMSIGTAVERLVVGDEVPDSILHKNATDHLAYFLRKQGSERLHNWVRADAKSVPDTIKRFSFEELTRRNETIENAELRFVKSIGGEYQNRRYQNTKLAGWRTEHCDFSHCRFVDCLLFGDRGVWEEVSLTQAEFERVEFLDLKLIRPDMRLAKFSVNTKFRRVTLTDARLNGAILEDVTFEDECSLIEAKLIGANLKAAAFRGVDLTGANLSHVRQDEIDDLRRSEAWEGHQDQRKVIFDEAILTGARFHGANLRFMSFRKANLTDAKFFGTFLQGADLRECDLSGAIFRGADLRGADLSGAKLNINDNATVFSRVRIDDRTILPFGWEKHQSPLEGTS